MEAFGAAITKLLIWKVAPVKVDGHIDSKHGLETCSLIANVNANSVQITSINGENTLNLSINSFFNKL